MLNPKFLSKYDNSSEANGPWLNYLLELDVRFNNGLSYSYII